MSISICRPVIVLYCTKYLHCDYFPKETFLCLEVSSEMCVTDLLAVVIILFLERCDIAEITQMFPLFVALKI